MSGYSESKIANSLVSGETTPLTLHLHDGALLNERSASVSPVAPHWPGYETLNQLGEGGTGIVYAVRETRLNVTRAIKVLKPDIIHNCEWFRRFARESKANSAIKHPNIAQVFELAFDHNNVPYLVMEFVDGISLKELLDCLHVLPESRGLEISIQVAAALTHAHKEGVIHRDLKPENIMLMHNTDAGEGGQDLVKIIDFGIAKLRNEGVIVQLTRTGELIGSPRYMSPEQSRGERIDHRSDIYSLGCVLFEMLCGEPLILGESQIELLLGHIEGKMQVKRLRKLKEHRINHSLRLIVEKMVQHDLRKRYRTMEEVLNDLSLARRRKLPLVERRRNFNCALKSVLACSFIALSSSMFFYHGASSLNAPKSSPETLTRSDSSLSGREILRLLGNAAEKDWGGRESDYKETASEAQSWRRSDFWRFGPESVASLKSNGPAVIPLLIETVNTSQGLSGRAQRDVCYDVLASFGTASADEIINELRTRNKPLPHDESLLKTMMFNGQVTADRALTLLDSKDPKEQMIGAKIMRIFLRYEPCSIAVTDNCRFLPADLGNKLINIAAATKDPGLIVELFHIITCLEPEEKHCSFLLDYLRPKHQNYLRYWAACDLGQLASKQSLSASKPSLDALCQTLLIDKNSGVRYSAARGLWFMADAEIPIPKNALMLAVRDKEKAVRNIAMKLIHSTLCEKPLFNG